MKFFVALVKIRTQYVDVLKTGGGEKIWTEGEAVTER